MIRDEVDYFTRTSARKLAHQIENYWHARGHKHVRVQAVRLEGFDSLMYGIKSNLVNGLPPRR